MNQMNRLASPNRDNRNVFSAMYNAVDSILSHKNYDRYENEIFVSSSAIYKLILDLKNGIYFSNFNEEERKFLLDVFEKKQ